MAKFSSQDDFDAKSLYWPRWDFRMNETVTGRCSFLYRCAVCLWPILWPIRSSTVSVVNGRGVFEPSRWSILRAVGLGIAILAIQFSSHAYLKAQETIRLNSAIVKTPPAIKIPGLQAGLLVEMSVKEGMRIEKGQFLAQVDPSEFQLDLAQSQLDHKLAQMNAANTTDRQYFEKSLVVEAAEYDRAVAANSRVPNSVPLSKLEKQRLEKERAVLQLEQSKKQLEIARFRTQLTQSNIATAKLKLDQTRVVAPSAGLVVGVSKQVGEWVQQSETICEIVATDTLRLEGMATAEQASQIRTGMEAMVVFKQPWLPVRELPAVVTFVAPMANPVNLQVPVWVEIENTDDKIVAGLTGQIVIQVRGNDAGDSDLGRAKTGGAQ